MISWKNFHTISSMDGPKAFSRLVDSEGGKVKKENYRLSRLSV
jgi:hypothetical protein